MEETREEKLRRWLEEKKAAKRAAASQQQQQSSYHHSSSVKRPVGSVSRSESVRRSNQPLQTPTTETYKKRQSTTSTAAGNFSRFQQQSEQQTPVGRGNSYTSSSSSKKTPSQRTSSSFVLKTPTNQRTDSSVSQESLDRRRRILEKKTLSSSTRKASSSSNRPESSRKRTESSAKKQLPLEDSTSKQTLSARRRAAISRTEEPTSVDLHDLSQMREYLMMLETVLLQWTYMNVRLDSVMEKQKRVAEKQLLSVWAYLNTIRSEALVSMLSMMKQSQAQQLHDQLEVQFNHFLPLSPKIAQFVRNYEKLSDSISSTKHVLPIHAGSEEDIVNELAALEKEFAQVQDIEEAVSFGQDMERLGKEVREELEALKKCKEFLLKNEYEAAARRSLLISQLEHADVQQYKIV